MSPPVAKIWSKLRGMSWDEVRTRVGQETGKRVEFTLARFGLLGGPAIHRRQDATPGNFFFSADEIPGRVALLQEHLPEQCAAIISEADEIMLHRFRLLGYRDLNYGVEIDWHLDAVHGKRAPLKPWYKIRFLDFERVGDHKIIWELNRHQHVVTLAKAAALTGKAEYVTEIQHQFYSWQKANPYPFGINWGSSLEVAFRSLSWLWVRNLMARPSLGEPSLSKAKSESTSSFDGDLLRGLARHGRYIERYLSIYFSPNTHLIGEAVALFFVGTLCREIPHAARWQQKGLAILVEEAKRQVRSDGVYFEQSLYYHVYALDFFLHARALASRNAIEVPPEFDAILKKMLEVLRVLCRNGTPEGFGDDDGGRVFNPRRNRAEHMSDPLALGACLYREESTQQSAEVTEEAIWLFGAAALSAQAKGSHRELSSCSFEHGGLYILASEDEHRGQMLVDAGPHGTGHGGHGHADGLSVRLSLDGQRWLIDPGAYVYISNNDERNQFRGTAAHNTLRVDKLDQAVPDTPFSWRDLPNVRTERWEAGHGFTLFEGCHDGYTRLAEPVLHRRTIFYLHGDYWLIRDVADGRGDHELELFWHFAPEVNVAVARDTVVAKGHGRELALLSAGSAEWQHSVEQGWVSPAYGEKIPAPLAVFRARLRLPTEHATLLLPVKAQLGRLRVDDSAQTSGAYIYERDAVTDQIVFGNGRESWSAGTIRSDAAFFFCRRDAREIVQLAFCDCTFVEIDGSWIFASAKRVTRMEWSAVAGASACDAESLKHLNSELLRSKTPVL